MRASAAPTQKWMPWPKAKWRLGDPRVRSIWSGLSNCAGSRFPAANSSRTVEPAGDVDAAQRGVVRDAAQHLPKRRL